MRTNLIIFLIVALILSGVGNYLQYRSADLAQRDRAAENDKWEKTWRKTLGHVAHRDSTIAVLFNQRDSLIQTHTKEQTRFKRQANASRARITGPPLAQDTVIIYLDSLVSDLEAEKDTVYVTNDAIVDSLRRQVSDVSELFKGQLQESIKLQGQVDREKKKRFSIGPHVGAGLRGADVGVSVQYSLFRF